MKPTRLIATLFFGLVLSVVASAIPPFTQQLLAQGTVRSADTAFAVSPTGVIDITVRRGDLMVRGTDGSSAELRGNNTNYQVRSSGVSVVMSMTGGNSAGSGASRSTRSNAGSRSSSSSSSDMELTIPRGTRLIVRGTSGDVEVTNVEGDVEIHVMSGDIITRSLGGRAILESLSGDVHVYDGVSDLRAITVSGDIVAAGTRGAIEVSTTSGDVTLTAERLSRVQVNSLSGDIQLTTGAAANARVQLTSHSGNIRLRLPERASGELEVSSFRGTVRGEQLTLMPNMVRSLSGNRNESNMRRYEFGGGGSTRITVTTFNGDITLVRSNTRDDNQ